MKYRIRNILPCVHRGACVLRTTPRAIVQWYGALVFGVLIIVLGLAHVWSISGLMETPVDTPAAQGGNTITINREALHDVLDSYARREQTFEALKRTTFSIADPGE